MLPRLAGIIPVKLFANRVKYNRPYRSASSSGRLPNSKLLETSKEVRADRRYCKSKGPPLKLILISSK
ncbi:hypothetical protein Mapa_001346 [Marchantia paleacea]|nr:hypothetical protein Mapa_001346 [Marchantia paleacea]